MNNQYAKLKKLFLRQSYLDSWEEYVRCLHNRAAIHWDYVVLTASNEDQAQGYRQQIDYRLAQGLLPQQTNYTVLPDPGGKRVGSGGATFHVLKYLSEQERADTENPFAQKRILVIHSGGDSKRVPQYSACGKLFSPVPRRLPDGRASTLFDEIMISMTGTAGRIPDGMLVLSGDVLILFNPLQIDAQFHGAAAVSVKADVAVGKNHGVFLNNGSDMVGRFLHKQSEKQLRLLGAVNDKNLVDLDTGAVLLDAELLNALFSLISTDGRVDGEKYGKFVNERARISFYGDFLYPLAEQSTLEDYYLEAAEGEQNEELHACRSLIWEALCKYEMKLICLSPAEFIHFGTTEELRNLVTREVEDYEFLDWKKEVCSFAQKSLSRNAALYNSVLEKTVLLGDHAYIENSYLAGAAKVGDGSIVSCLRLDGVTVPENVVLHGIRLQDGNYVVRVYAAGDNPKGCLTENAPYLHTTLQGLLRNLRIERDELWRDPAHTGDDLWNAELYPVCADEAEAVGYALFLCRAAAGEDYTDQERDNWLRASRLSLCGSFNRADTSHIMTWRNTLRNEILVRKFLCSVRKKKDFRESLQIFGERGICEEQFLELMEYAKTAPFSDKIRIYYDLSQYVKQRNAAFDGYDAGLLEGMCFDSIRDEIFSEGRKAIGNCGDLHIVKEEVRVALPVRVNWGGGWTDTPPQCSEQGGVVLNAAVSLNGILPVQVTVRRIERLHFEFESADVGVKGAAESVREIQDCHNPYDFFSLHKAALIACGIVPMEGGEELTKILERLGGGIYLSTQVAGVPKGSGLGTSSILSGACVKALLEFLGKEPADETVYETVSCMEQIMSTGGGWQDQVGGLTGGIKFITTRPGIRQNIEVSYLRIPETAKKELQDRFALIYTGQRRLARNLLRDVVGNYIGGRPESVEALYEMKRVAAMMRFELEEGNIDEFANLLNRHWELSKKLDAGSTNTCIEQIFLACGDMIDGRFIAGAGGGGFIQVILKRNVTKEQLQERLKEMFQDSGVRVWDCRFV